MYGGGGGDGCGCCSGGGGGGGGDKGNGASDADGGCGGAILWAKRLLEMSSVAENNRIIPTS